MSFTTKSRPEGRPSHANKLRRYCFGCGAGCAGCAGWAGCAGLGVGFGFGGCVLVSVVVVRVVSFMTRVSVC